MSCEVRAGFDFLKVTHPYSSCTWCYKPKEHLAFIHNNEIINQCTFNYISPLREIGVLFLKVKQIIMLSKETAWESARHSCGGEAARVKGHQMSKVRWNLMSNTPVQASQASCLCKVHLSQYKWIISLFICKLFKFRGLHPLCFLCYLLQTITGIVCTLVLLSEWMESENNRNVKRCPSSGTLSHTHLYVDSIVNILYRHPNSDWSVVKYAFT